MSESAYATTTRAALHTIAAHILARKRFGVSGRFGLRAGPGGIATPSFGDAPETIRLVEAGLIREVGGTCTRMSVDGSTLRELAAFTDADLDEPFSCGPDTPPLGPVDVAFRLATHTVIEIADWFALAWRVLDDVLTSLPGDAEVATIQLWPEHFDAATTVTMPSGERVNLGVSPGDDYLDEPYAYVGPWGERRGDPAFWNAPFGAARPRSQVGTVEGVVDFLGTGLRLATAG